MFWIFTLKTVDIRTFAQKFSSLQKCLLLIIIEQTHRVKELMKSQMRNVNDEISIIIDTDFQ